jgi:hypothetical protein
MFRNYFKEAAKLRGISVYYQFPIDMNLTIHAEERPMAFSEKISIDIIFEQNPKVQTLRRYGWVPSQNEDKPFICSVAYDTPNLSKGCRITIPAPTPIASDSLFVITDIKMNLEFPDSYVCKLAPVFEDKKDISTNYDSTNTNFLKVDL